MGVDEHSPNALVLLDDEGFDWFEDLNRAVNLARRHNLPVIVANKRDVLMVGDTLHTDILGGNKYGIDTALVLSGTTLPTDYHAMIQSTGIVPNYVCESILT